LAKERYLSKRLISEMLHIKHQKNSLNLQSDKEYLDNGIISVLNKHVLFTNRLPHLCNYLFFIYLYQLSPSPMIHQLTLIRHKQLTSKINRINRNNRYTRLLLRVIANPTFHIYNCLSIDRGEFLIP